jgi:hypothetical protein
MTYSLSGMYDGKWMYYGNGFSESSVLAIFKSWSRASMLEAIKIINDEDDEEVTYFRPFPDEIHLAELYKHIIATEVIIEV